jgi:plastocyanin
MLHPIGWRWTLATCGALVAVGLGCWTASAASEGRTEAPVVTVTAGKPTEFAFMLSKTSALPALVTFKVTNRGVLAHAFTIGGAATRILRPGQSAVLTVSFAKPGTYEYRSSLPGQAAKGMRGRVVVVTPTPAAKPPATAAAPPPVPAVAAATPSPVPPPALEAPPAQAAEPEPPPKVNQCGECHYD